MKQYRFQTLENDEWKIWRLAYQTPHYCLANYLEWLKNIILLNGHVRDNLFYSDDTIIHPHQGEYLHRPFYIEIDSSGALTNGKITDWSMVVSDIDRDESGDIFFAGFVWDIVVFGTDTLIRHEDTTVNIIAKLNADYEPEWYETAKAKTLTFNRGLQSTLGKIP